VTRVDVLIPYGPGDPHRERALGFVTALYCEAFPSWRLRIVRDEEKPFNRARVLNQAVRESKADIVVFNDADTICTPGQTVKAFQLAEEAPGFVFAYTLYLRLSEWVTGALDDWTDALDAPAEWGMMYAGSQGCSAVRREDFVAIGMLDERFAGWGYEDLEFNRRADEWDERAGCRRVPGELRHLWHGDRRADDSPLSADPADVARNYQLWQETLR